MLKTISRNLLLFLVSHLIKRNSRKILPQSTRKNNSLGHAAGSSEPTIGRPSSRCCSRWRLLRWRSWTRSCTASRAEGGGRRPQGDGTRACRHAHPRRPASPDALPSAWCRAGRGRMGGKRTRGDGRITRGKGRWRTVGGRQILLATDPGCRSRNRTKEDRDTLETLFYCTVCIFTDHLDLHSLLELLLRYRRSGLLITLFIRSSDITRTCRQSVLNWHSNLHELAPANYDH